MADRRLELAGLGTILLVGAAVGILRAPESPTAARLARWPLVGPAVEALRERGRRSRPPGRRVEEAPALAPAPGARRIELPVPPGPAATEGRVAPWPSAPVAAPGAIDRSVEPAGPLPPRRPDPARLSRAAELLGPAPRRSTVGPYGFLGDLDPPERWSELAAALDGAFAERTGRAPRGEPAETVIAVADPAVHRALVRLEPRLAGLDAGGHAIAGLAVLRVDPGRPESSEATLVHELVHLVSRRAIGPALPPWLEEGLAEDLAQAPWDPDRARFRTDALRGAVRREGSRIEISGARAGLDLLVATMNRGELPRLAALVATEWEEMVGARGAERYAHALQLVRFLLDGGDARRASGFRSFLDGIAAGGGADREALERALGEPLERLEGPFRAWLALRRRIEVDAAVEGLARPGERLERSQPAPSGSSSRHADEPSS